MIFRRHGVMDEKEPKLSGCQQVAFPSPRLISTHQFRLRHSSPTARRRRRERQLVPSSGHRICTLTAEDAGLSGLDLACSRQAEVPRISSRGSVSKPLAAVVSDGVLNAYITFPEFLSV
jgi:hypothetical protein